jgi:hypothetical protein
MHVLLMLEQAQAAAKCSHLCIKCTCFAARLTIALHDLTVSISSTPCQFRRQIKAQPRLDVQKLEYLVNGAFFGSFDVAGSVVPVSLELSHDELHFAFALDNWDTVVDQVRSNCLHCVPKTDWNSLSTHLCVDQAHLLFLHRLSAKLCTSLPCAHAQVLSGALMLLLMRLRCLEVWPASGRKPRRLTEMSGAHASLACPLLTDHDPEALPSHIHTRHP